MSDLPPRPAFWPYLPGYALLLLSVLLCASGSYRFVTPMALADGIDLVYLSQGLALLPLGTGLVGLLHGRPSTLLRKGLLGLGWLALVAWLGLLFYLQRLYGLTF
ncbi:TPA: hypothetical protein N0H37_004722 [Pseudomonas aeruginosa]|nr:hypothetical protein [Pseudomonas aeruginosa]HCK4772977.1 hypothetical protein [Pseudomonas aeruginosa]